MNENLTFFINTSPNLPEAKIYTHKEMQLLSLAEAASNLKLSLSVKKSDMGMLRKFLEFSKETSDANCIKTLLYLVKKGFVKILTTNQMLKNVEH